MATGLGASFVRVASPSTRRSLSRSLKAPLQHKGAAFIDVTGADDANELRAIPAALTGPLNELSERELCPISKSLAAQTFTCSRCFGP